VTEPLPAQEVAARLAETLALVGWEGVDVEDVTEHGVVALRFTARPLGPVQPVVSPYGAASSLTGARQRVRDRSRVIGAVLAQQTRERREITRADRAEGARLDDIPGEVEQWTDDVQRQNDTPADDFDADYQGGNS